MLYIASAIHIPQWAIQQYNTLIRNFIWNNEPSKIKYTTLISPIESGGLKLQDLQSKIEANNVTWVKNILNTEVRSPWKAYLQQLVKDPIESISLQNKNKNRH